MALEIGIVGLPNVGKSTLFKALTRNNVLIANYPFATIEPNTGVVPVPDERLNKLAAVFNPPKTVPASVHFTDIAGLIAGAHKGEGLGNNFLSHIRQTDAICLVTRTFVDSDITHVDTTIDPAKDIDVIKTELALADVETINSAQIKLHKQSKTNLELGAELKKLLVVRDQLNEGGWPDKGAYEFEASELKGLVNSLLTAKPILYVFNVDEKTLQDEPRKKELSAIVSPDEAVYICAKLEAELAELEPIEAAELLTSMELDSSGLESLIKRGYQTLKLETFFTAGETEVRAWTISDGSKAPVAASKIHTDFQRGFVSAEVINWEELVETGGWVEAKAKGQVRNEGKDYIVQEGDVITFKFNL